MNQERWSDIPGFPGYQISDQGRVASYRRSVKKYLSLKGKWYIQVNLMKNGKVYSRRVADLVLSTFVGQKPYRGVIRHLNDIKTDNRLSNLAYGSQLENCIDSIKNGHTRGLKSEDVINLRNEYKRGGISMGELANRYRISLSSASRIINGSRRSHIN